MLAPHQFATDHLTVATFQGPKTHPCCRHRRNEILLLQFRLCAPDIVVYEFPSVTMQFPGEQGSMQFRDGVPSDYGASTIQTLFSARALSVSDKLVQS